MYCLWFWFNFYHFFKFTISFLCVVSSCEQYLRIKLVQAILLWEVIIILTIIYKSYIRYKLEFPNTICNPYFSKDVGFFLNVQQRITKMPPEIKSLSYETRLKRMNLHFGHEKNEKWCGWNVIYKIINNHYNCTMINLFMFNKNIKSLKVILSDSKNIFIAIELDNPSV